MQIKKFGTVLLILMLCCFTACASGEKTSNADVSISIDGSEEPTLESVSVLNDMVDKTTVVLYFADEQGNLVAQKRDIPKVDGIARMTVNELIKGPDAASSLLPTIPPETKLKDISISDGLCTVDFNRALKENHPGGSSSELVTVYSIVNTLTQFSTVEKVQILLDGQVVETLAGHVELTQPLERNDDIIVTADALK